MKTTKRLLSFVLVLAMLLTMASFPAFAEESEYTYTPKEIEFEAALGNWKYSEPYLIARPSDYDIYVGDKLVLPEGGLTMIRTAQVLETANSPTSTKIAPQGIAIDFYQNSANVNAGYSDKTYHKKTGDDAITPADGVERFYFAVDSTQGDYGVITGIYPSMADMIAGTNECEDGITLDKAGLWAVSVAYAVFYNDTIEPTLCFYASNADVDYNNTQLNSPNCFSFEVKPQPTSEPVKLSAPAVPAGITTTDIKDSLDTTAPTYPNLSTSNSIYARTYGYDNDTVIGKNVKIVGMSDYLTCIFSGISIDLTAPAYIEDFTISSGSQYFSYFYTVYGSLDGVNWYAISDGIRNTTKTNSHNIQVGGIAKYFRIDTKYFGGAYNTSYGAWRDGTLSSVNGKLNVLEGLAVTVEGDVTDSLTTDANGKVDFSELLADYPAGEYIYKIGEEDVTEKLADYVFTSATTVTVTKYVAPTGYVVTFKGDQGDKEAVADFNTGLYEVPAEYKGYYSFYKDEYYATKFDVTAKVEADTTVYAKTEVKGYTPKTVVFPIKQTPTNVSFATRGNGPIAAPSETIYVGDTMSIPHESYKDVINFFDNKTTEVLSLKMRITRYGTADDTEGEHIDLDFMTDVTYTFEKPGIYNIRYTQINTMRTDGEYLRSNFNGFNCIVEVLPAPEGAPEVAIAPEYTGAEGEVVALLDTANGTDITDTTIAFKKYYGYSRKYNDTTEVAINSTMTEGAIASDGGEQLVSNTHYLQFNLSDVYYVSNITITGCLTYDYETYGSLDGENWYFLNSGAGTTNYAVEGVARYVRIYQKSADSWLSGITGYAVNGYEIDEAQISEDSATVWVAQDGTETEVTSVASLPVAYSDGESNYAVTAWKVRTANGLAEISLRDMAFVDVTKLGKIYPVVEEIPVNADSLAATLTPAGDDATAGKTFGANKYINGFYVEGTQIRVAEGEGDTEIEGGLRFVNILDNALVAELDALVTAGTVTSYKYGTLAMASTKYTGGDLVIGYNEFCKPVEGERLFARADSFEDKYFKYTVCVTNIDEEYYTKDVMVRPYLTINLEDGSSVTLYGEQYQTSLYAAAVFARDNDNTLTTEQQAEIVSITAAVEG